MEYNYYIYMTTNLINNKKYIGKRKCKCEIDQDEYLGSGKILKYAIKKYGQKNFSKEILEICEDEAKCNEREKYWISLYDASHNENFYNIALGGDGGNTYEGLNNEELDRIRKIKSEQSKGENNPRYGVAVSRETREKQSRKTRAHYLKTGKGPTSGKFGKNNKLSMSIYCPELNKIFDGIREASRILNIPEPNIIRALKSNGKFTAGKNEDKRLHWFYWEETYEFCC